MTTSFSISDLLTHTKRIYFSEPTNLYSQALASYLLSFGIPSSQLPQHIAPSSPPAVIIHFAGFTNHTLEATLDFTSHLHDHLQLAALYHCPFVLVLTQQTSALYHTAKLLCQQFVQVYPATHLTVVEIRLQTPPDQAAPYLAKTFIDKLVTLSPTNSSSTVRKPKKIVLLLSAIFTIWSAFILQLAGLYLSITCSYRSLYSANWNTAKACSKTAGFLSRILPFQSYLAFGSRPLLTSLGYPSQHIYTFSSHFADNLYWGAVAGEAAFPYYQNLLSGLPVSLPSDTSTLLYATTRLSQSLSTTHEFLVATQATGILSDLERQFNQARLTSSKLLTLIPDLPRLLGLSDQRQYIVLIQDPHTPRPLGGTISEYALFTLTKGQLTDVQVLAATSVDTAISGQVQAPSSFVAATSKSSWTFSDSLWEPDFSQAKDTTLWFLAKGPQLQPDGVFATTTTFVSGLTDIVGSSTSLSQLSMPENIELLHRILTGFEHRQIMYQSNALESLSIAKIGWDGGVRPLSCRALSCLTDVVAVSESFTVNQPLIRSTNLAVNFNSAQISSVLTLIYTAPPGSTPSTNSNFIRLILPPNSQLSSIKLNGHRLPSTDYSQTALTDRELLTLPIQLAFPQPTEISVVYDRPFTSKDLRYQLTVLNQPGRSQDPLYLSLSYPPTWSARAGSTPKFAVAGQLEYNTTLNSPQSFSFDFSQ